MNPATRAAHEAETVLDLFEWFSTIGDAQTLADKIAEAGAALGGYGAALLTLALPEGTVIGGHDLSESELAHFRAHAREAGLPERVERRRRLREMAFPGTGIVYLRHASDRDWNVLASPPGRCVPGGTWDARDTLYVLIRGRGGEDVGVLSLDAPLDGMAPAEDGLERLRLVERMVGAASSLLETRLMQERLLGSEKRFHALVEQAAESIFLVAREGRVIHANLRACAGLGYGPDEVRELHLRDFAVDFDPSQLEALWESAAAGPVTVEGHHRRRDGSTFPVEVRIGRMELGGEPVFVAFARNVERRRKLEERLRRTDTMDALGRMASGLAHDFNNLLGVIRGSVELAGLKHGASHELELIQRAAEDAARLTERLLAFGRDRPRTPSRMDLNEAVAARASLLRGVLGTEVDFVLDTTDAPCPVLADAGEIGQVLVNLATNARDAIGERGRFRVSVRREEAAVVLEAADDGTGMDAATRERLFEPLFSTKGEQGTGLGLATVYAIVQRMGGTIDLSSEPGAGTTFRLVFPAVP